MGTFRPKKSTRFNLYTGLDAACAVVMDRGPVDVATAQSAKTLVAAFKCCRATSVRKLV